MKNYTQAPLPFQGQKRRFLNDFKKALHYFPADATYVDLFGGSGLLSHTVKQFYPTATVIYNDFDNYFQRIENIDTTNKIISDIRYILKDYPNEQRITGEYRTKILERIRQEK